MSKVARTVRSWLKKQDLIWGRVSSTMAATFPIVPVKMFLSIKLNSNFTFLDAIASLEPTM